MSKKLKKAYQSSIHIYDDLLTQNSVWGKLYMNVFWSGVDDKELTKNLLKNIPDDFSGTLLDVPVGTAIFSQEKWGNLTKAQIICLDYSQDMLAKAKERLGDCQHISCVQGDVGNLQQESDSCDIVISMNGFHAFPDTGAAYREIHRVLKEDGCFIACFYIKGQNKRTDWLVKHILAKKGWFTPPFQRKEQVEETLGKLFHQVDLHVDGSMVYFRCEKKKAVASSAQD